MSNVGRWADTERGTRARGICTRRVLSSTRRAIVIALIAGVSAATMPRPLQAQADRATVAASVLGAAATLMAVGAEARYQTEVAQLYRLRVAAQHSALWVAESEDLLRGTLPIPTWGGLVEAYAAADELYADGECRPGAIEALAAVAADADRLERLVMFGLNPISRASIGDLQSIPDDATGGFAQVSSLSRMIRQRFASALTREATMPPEGRAPKRSGCAHRLEVGGAAQ